MDSAMPLRNPDGAKLSAEERRRQILELNEEDQAYSSRWTQQPGAKFHPLWKLVAQISFGVHLLHKNLAKSEDEVIRILQRHVDEVDSFAEDTTADFDLAIKDIKERIQCLLLPLEHSRTFNKMLCDKNFRTSILQGNDIIEKVIKRTRMALTRSLNDVAKGMEAVTELAKYLDRLWSDWPNQHHDLIDAYHVMRGNTEGWYRCFRRLEAKGDQLSDAMVKLEAILEEVALRAGIASRRKTPTGVSGKKKQRILAEEVTEAPRPSTSSAIDARRSSCDKPLPRPPDHRNSYTAHRSLELVKPTSPTDTTAPTSPTYPVSRKLSVATQLHQPRETPIQPPSPDQYEPILERRHTTDLQMPHRRTRSDVVKRGPHQLAMCSPVDTFTSPTADSGYSSCPDTPALSPETAGTGPVRTLSTTSTMTPLSPHTPERNTLVDIQDVLVEEMSEMTVNEERRVSNESVTALPVFKATPAFMEEARKYSLLKNSSVKMRSLFAKKPLTRRDVSGGVGGCVIIT